VGTHRPRLLASTASTPARQDRNSFRPGRVGFKGRTGSCDSGAQRRVRPRRLGRCSRAAMMGRERDHRRSTSYQLRAALGLPPSPPSRSRKNRKPRRWIERSCRSGLHRGARRSGGEVGLLAQNHKEPSAAEPTGGQFGRPLPAHIRLRAGVNELYDLLTRAKGAHPSPTTASIYVPDRRRRTTSGFTGLVQADKQHRHPERAPHFSQRPGSSKASEAFSFWRRLRGSKLYRRLRAIWADCGGRRARPGRFPRDNAFEGASSTFGVTANSGGWAGGQPLFPGGEAGGLDINPDLRPASRPTGGSPGTVRPSWPAERTVPPQPSKDPPPSRTCIGVAERARLERSAIPRD